MARLLQFVHAALAAQGAETEWLVPFPGERAALLRRVEILKRKKNAS